MGSKISWFSNNIIHFEIFHTMQYFSLTDNPPASHSYGYECHKRFNLVVLGISVVAYAAGNLVIILDLESQQQTRLRSLGGGGIGAIAVSLVELRTLKMILILPFAGTSQARVLCCGRERNKTSYCNIRIP